MYEKIEYSPEVYQDITAKVEKANPDFAKAVLNTIARIELNVLNFPIESSAEKIKDKLFLHVPVKLKIQSKGTKASLILNLGVRLELIEISEGNVGWCNYSWNQDKYHHSVKSNNCDGVSDDDMLTYFFMCISADQYYPFDDEIKGLMQFSEAKTESLNSIYQLCMAPKIEPESEMDNSLLSE